MTKPLLLTLLMAVAAMGQPTQDPHMPEIGQCWECKWDVLDHELVWIVPQTSDTNYVAFRGVNGMLFNNTWTVAEFRWQWHWISDPTNIYYAVENSMRQNETLLAVTSNNDIIITLPFTNTITVGSNVYRVKDGALQFVSGGIPTNFWGYPKHYTNVIDMQLEGVEDDMPSSVAFDWYSNVVRLPTVEWMEHRKQVAHLEFGFTISNAIGEGTYSNEYAVLTWRGEKHTNWLERTLVPNLDWVKVGGIGNSTNYGYNYYEANVRAEIISHIITPSNAIPNELFGRSIAGLYFRSTPVITTNWQYDYIRAPGYLSPFPTSAFILYTDEMETISISTGDREQGYVSDGRMVWRHPPEGLSGLHYKN